MRHQGPDDQTAERLLDTAATPHHPVTPLARLLAAAAAPARPDELAGEDTALAAFRAARGRPAVPGPASRPARRTAPLMAWLAGLAVVATAGAAVAAVDLRPPVPPPVVPPSVPAATSGPPPIPTRSAPQPPPSRPEVAPSTAVVPGPPGRTPERDQPEPDIPRGQCVAYLSQPPGHRDRLLAHPAYQRLLAAAGGADQVEAYCRDRVDPPTPGRPGPPPPR